MRKRILGITMAFLVALVIIGAYLIEAIPCDSVTYYAFGNAIKIENCEK